MKNRDILISGASIAGPALAFWLRRYGFNPTVVERAPAPRDGGQAVDLRGTARDVAERMGLMDEIRRAHTGALGMSFVDDNGKRVANMDAKLLGDSGGVIADIEILRGDLVRILYDASREGVEYIFGDAITSMREDAEGVHVTFEHAAPRMFALVIGADGVHSGVRALAFGPESRYVRDMGCYVAIFSAPNHLHLDGWELLYTVPGKTAGIYPMKQDGKSKAMFYFASPKLTYDRHDIAAQKRILAETFAGGRWEVGTLLKAMEDAPDFYFDSIGQVQMDRWSRGRVALLGDAAWCPSPMAGGGASLALVGAYVLAGELAAAGDDHHAAFVGYEAAMRDIVTRSQKLASSAASGLIPTSRMQIRIRNQAIRVLPYLPFKQMLFGDHQKTANAVTLKDYPGLIPARGMVAHE